MMILDCDVAKEIVSLLSCFEESYTSKIPQEILEYLISLSAQSKKEYFFSKKALKEQIISEECKDFLSYFFYKDLDPLNQKVLFQIWGNNTKENG